jgi:hypothetical protein
MNTLKALFGGVGAIIVAIALIIGVTFGGGYLSLTVYKTFATKWESARTDVYRENKSYVEGTIRDLRDLRREYITAEEGHKDAIRSLILHRAGELDWDRLPADLREFLNELEAV